MRNVMRPSCPHMSFILLLISICLSTFCTRLNADDPPLTLDYYGTSCPSVFDLIWSEMQCSVTSDPRNAALVLRLHMHDCFVQGCDGSVLLDDTLTLQGEKKATQNQHSLKGFKIIDRMKNLVEAECPGVVSCADILTIAARDAVILAGGPYWDVFVGRKDARTTSLELANANLPAADESLLSITSKFLYQGLSGTDMAALSGAHTIGMARCANYRSRIYGDVQSTSDDHLLGLRSTCPAGGGGDDNVSALDYVTPNLFDNSYYQIIQRGEGLLNSDQELYSSIFSGIETKSLVESYAEDELEFFNQFGESMVKMGNISNADSFVTGEIRKNCRFVNSLIRSE